MNNKLKVLIIGVIILLIALPTIVSSEETFGTVTCSYVSLIHYYRCSDLSYYPSYDEMVNHYTPVMTQIEPDYTFVTGAATETFTP